MSDKFKQHELLHTLYIIQELFSMVTDSLEDVSTAENKKLIDDIERDLGRLYQGLSKEFSDDSQTENIQCESCPNSVMLRTLVVDNNGDEIPDIGCLKTEGGLCESVVILEEKDAKFIVDGVYYPLSEILTRHKHVKFKIKTHKNLQSNIILKLDQPLKMVNNRNILHALKLFNVINEGNNTFIYDYHTTMTSQLEISDKMIEAAKKTLLHYGSLGLDAGDVAWTNILKDALMVCDYVIPNKEWYTQGVEYD